VFQHCCSHCAIVNGAYIILLCDCLKHPELQQHVIFLQNNVAPHHHHGVQILQEAFGLEVLACPPYSLDVEDISMLCLLV